MFINQIFVNKTFFVNKLKIKIKIKIKIRSKSKNNFL